MICADAGRAAARHDNCSDALDKREGMCYSRCHEQSEAVEVATRRWVARAQSLLGPASPCTCGQTCGGGGSYQCRGGSDRHVGSLLGGAFKPSRLAGGCHWLPAPSGARAGLRLRELGEGSPGVLRERAPSQHLAPRGERRRSVPASISPISAETASHARLPVPALNNKETLL